MIITNGKAFFDSYRLHFGKLNQDQVDGLNNVLEAFAEDPLLTDVPHAAYMLATVYHETAQTFQPIYERGRRSYFHKYDGRYGNNQAGDGFRYRGRGYVQLTFRNNYLRASNALNKLNERYDEPVDLVADPDLALDPQIASDIMLIGMREGWFTGRRLGDYLNSSKVDYINARKIINGLDHALEISDYAVKFENILHIAELREDMAEASTLELRMAS
ncbi:hypothetical protein [Candidatus Albibeggiatoa sp. nov. NOAA]|uniref:hypothetical protein n=1 Tax=Candidatus Albibeggiatoa sp. nov. NOAA TaxID=3162724 RepID=UPI003302A298|nr:hypothetical protein [Thiotrichaceae bacterium]